MMKTLVAALLLALPARADEASADSCLRTKIWDGYNTGWAVRTATKTSLGQGDHRIYLVTLYSGNEYKIMACGDETASNIDIVVYDAVGNEVTRDATQDKEPTVSYRATSTDTYYIAVHAVRNADAAKKAGIATAVTYK
jgi:hypothetical protein